MKKVLILLTTVLLGMIILTCQNQSEGYDPELAAKLGADDYGMKSYVLVILKTGMNEVQDTALRASLFAGHFENMNRLSDQGKLIVAGPLSANENSYRGIFILDVSSFEEANELLKGDPTVKEGIFDTELYEWYGSAALPEYLKVHSKIEKTKVP